jgi:Cys-tRNA(Pro)/Cys-tRNA(Cys) deacylase
MTIYDEVMQCLNAAGVAYALHRHEAVQTVADVEEKLPHLTARMLKTIAFRLRNGRYVLVGLRGYDRIDYRKLARELGINRRDVATLSPLEVAAELGFEVGGVGPFALRPDVLLLFDRRLSQMQTVFCGSGCNTETVEIVFADLLAVSHGRMADLAKEVD